MYKFAHCVTPQVVPVAKKPAMAKQRMLRLEMMCFKFSTKDVWPTPSLAAAAEASASRCARISTLGLRTVK